jgi:hypothetical protein
VAVGVQPVVAEGVAELGAELMATEECHALVAEVLKRRGVSYEAAVGLRVASAQRGLRRDRKPGVAPRRGNLA